MIVIEGRVYFQGAVQESAIGIVDGKIAAVKANLKGEEHHKFPHCLILPAATDLHVHLRDPGSSAKEDFATGTAAAARGGVTTVADMPNTKPPVATVRVLRDKISWIGGKANVDHFLYASPTTPIDAGFLQALGVPLKFYLGETTATPSIPAPNLLQVLEKLQGYRGLLSHHCEDASAFSDRIGEDLRGYNRQRPLLSEQSAIRTLLSSCGTLRPHVAHVTSAAVLHDIDPSRLTTEVTPHHLLLDDESPLQAQGKVNPPLRSRKDREDSGGSSPMVGSMCWPATTPLICRRRNGTNSRQPSRGFPGSRRPSP